MGMREIEGRLRDPAIWLANSHNLASCPCCVFQCRVRSRNLYGMSGYSDTICFPDPEACSSSSSGRSAAGQADMWYNHHQSREGASIGRKRGKLSITV